MQLSCFLHFVNPVAQAKDAEESGRREVLRLPELSNENSTHHGDSSCATEPQDAAVEAANPGRQRQDSSEGMPSPSGQPLGQWHGKRKHVPTACEAMTSDKGEIIGTSKAIQRRLMTPERTPHSNRCCFFCLFFPRKCQPFPRAACGRCFASSAHISSWIPCSEHKGCQS